MTIGNVREDFAALANCIHLNTGGIALMPDCVTQELLRLPKHVAERGPAALLWPDESVIRSEWAHQTVADFLCVDAGDVAFTGQFSSAVSLVVEGLSWQPGDEIVVSDQEHPALLIPVLNAASRRGLVIRRFPVSENADETLESLSSALTSQTRLVAASHVTTENGIRLPVSDMCELAHQNGSLVLLDGAQALGQFPVNLRDIGCDFYCFLGYKWLYGPFTSAGIYIKRNVLNQVAVTWTGSRATETAEIDMDCLDFWPDARRFEFGGRPYADESAMATGVEYVSRLGLDAIERHARELSQYLHSTLRDLSGVNVRSPLTPEQMTGIVTFSLEGVSGEGLALALRERWGILTRSALSGASLRVSIAAFTSQRDLDQLVTAVAHVAAGR